MYWTTLGSTLGVGLKCLLSIYHLLQLHCWLWGCCSFAGEELQLRKGIFCMAAEPRQSCSPGSGRAGTRWFQSWLFLQKLPWFSLAQLLCVDTSQSLSEWTKSLSKAFNLQTAGEWGWSSPAVLHLSCSRSGGAEPEKKAGMHLTFLAIKPHFAGCSLFRITWWNCAKKRGFAD